MRRIILLITVLFSTLFFSEKAFGSHLAGGDISVKHLSGNQFEISVTLYADCSSFLNLNSEFNPDREVGIVGSCFTDFTVNVPVLNPGGTEVSQVCPNALPNTQCNSSTGSLPGLLRFDYQTTITMPSTSCEAGFRYTLYARNPSNNIVNSDFENFYIETVVDYATSSQNSTPEFAFDPLAYAIQNQPINLSFGANDPDGDSLKYSLVGALGYNPTTSSNPIAGSPFNLSYLSGYSATSPIQGITLNQNTGSVSALPTNTGKFVIVVKVEEFNSSGQLIGEIVRDIQLIVEPGTNNVPTSPNTFTNFSGWADSLDQSTISAYPGMDFCIDITFSDNDASDSLSLVTNLTSVLPGASLNLTGSNPLTANVCWTATAGMPVSNTVVFNVSDSACPVSGASSYSLNVLVPPCNGLVGRVRTQDASCAGSCDGWAKVKMFCGSGNYTYNWVNTNVGPIPPNDSVTLCASSTQYNLVVTDNSTSEVYSKAVSIQEPPTINISSSTNAASCGGACDGSISTIVTGGTPPFNYSWGDVSSNTAFRAGLCAGTYDLTVTDQKGCEKIESYTIVSPPSINSSVVSVTDPLCAGGSSGEVAIESIVGCGNVPSPTCPGLDTAQVGTGNIVLSGNNYPAIYGASNKAAKHQMVFTASELQAQGVEAGPIEEIAFFVGSGNVQGFASSYDNFEIKMGCSSVSDLSGGFEAGLGPVFSVQSTMVMVGWNNYQFPSPFYWDGQSNVVVEVCFTNSGSGVSGGNSHENLTNTGQPMTRYFAAENDSVCVSPGAGNTSTLRPNVRFKHCADQLDYSWSPAPAAGQNNDTVTGLPAGTYTVTVTNSANCKDTLTVNVTDPPPFTTSISLDQAVSCPGVCDAQVTASSTGGAAPITYSWDNGLPNGATQSGLCGGVTYNVTATDDNNCTSTAQITITDPTAINLSATVDVPVSCNGDCDAEISASASGGGGGFTYAWSGGLGNGQTQIGVCGNQTYTVTATDANGCSETAQVTVNEPAVLSASITTDSPVSCNGVCDGSVTASGSGGTSPYTYAWDGGLGNSASQTTLCGGQTYNVTVTDARGCTATDQVTLTEPPAITTSSTVNSDASCNGACDGDAQVSASGGAGGFTYDWNGTITGQNPTNLCAGTYDVTVTDANGCTAIEQVVIAEPAPVNVTINLDQAVSCNGVCDGEVTASATGGNGGFTYTWDNGLSNGANQTGLCGATTYNVTATDANGCTGTAQITISEPSSINVSATVDLPVSCNGVCDGEISASATGGAGGFTYAWSGGLGNGQTQTGVCGNQTYTVTATDANGCTETAQVTVNEPVALTVSITTDSPVSCNGVCDGAVTASGSGGNAPYTFTWDGGLGNGASQTALCGGQTYTVTITDGNGCTATDQVTLTEPSAITTSSTVNSDASCNGACDGDAQVSASGGSAPYTYDWNGTITGQNPTNLCAGTYDVTVTDNNGCTAIEQVIIGEPSPVVASITIDQPVTCGGVCDGQITASATGGDGGPFTFTWFNGLPAGATQSNLCGDSTYTVIATDGNGCADTTSITLTDPSTINLTATVDVPVSCNGVCDGEISASATGGAGGFTYAWSGGLGNGQTQTGVCGNQTYTVTATDANGCSETAQVTVNEPAALTASITTDSPVSCNGVCDGAVTASGSGGTAPYTFTWDGGLGNGASQTALCGGQTYTVTITDDNGCTATDQVTLADPAVLTATSTVNSDASCNGVCDGDAEVTPSGGTAPYTYDWNGTITGQNPTNLCAGTYDVTVSDDNGCTVIEQVVITEPGAVVASITIDQPVSCSGVCDAQITASATGGDGGPFTFTWLNGLPAGATQSNLCGDSTYTVIATDGSGCTDTADITLTDPATISLTTTVINDASCNGSCDGSGFVTASGGTAPYTYNWSNSTSNDTIDSICAGTYLVTVTDAGGCSEIDSVVISEPTPLNFSASIQTPVTCAPFCNGEAVATAPSGGTPPYSLTWSNGDSGLVADSVCPGLLQAFLVDDNGCTDTLDLNFASPAAFSVSITSSTDVTCPGGNDGSASASVNNPTPDMVYNWAPAPGAGQGTLNATQLSAGTYSITVTDTVTNCTDVAQVTINEPAPININFSNTIPISCNGVCDGELSVSATGGNGGFAFSWSTSGTGTTQSNLCAGVYYVTATDDSGCVAIDSFDLSEPAPITLATSSNDESCAGACDGTATVTPSGGTAPYTYQWPGGGSDSTDTALCVGPVTVTVTDDNGCTNTATINVNGPQPLVLTDQIISQPSCNGGCDGQASVSVTGGTSPYTFNWSGGGSGTSQSNLCAGTTTVTVTDDNGCTDTVNIQLQAPNGINATIVENQSISCNGSCDGELEVNITQGLAPFVFTWSNSGSTQVQSGLCAGTYSVTIEDANNCISTLSYNLTEPAAIAMNPSTTDPNCGACDGVIDASVVTNGVAPFTYTWSGITPNPGNVSIVNNLCPGAYGVTVTDAGGCADTALITLSSVGAPGGTITGIDPTCFDSCNGSVEVTPVGGTQPYDYQWSTSNPNDTTEIITGVCDGIYTVTVTDATGCQLVLADTLDNPAPLSASTSTTDVTCNGACDGEIVVTPTSGSGPYTFNWSDSGTDSVRTGLCADTYFLTMTDGSGCVLIDTFTISEPTAITSSFVDTTDATCFNSCDGIAEVSASGGNGSFTYNWSSGASGSIANNLCVGENYVTITDGTGCSIIDTIDIGAPPAIVIDTAIIEDASCSADTGSIEVVATGGQGSLTYSWNGGALSGNPITGLSGGVYNLTITDTTGCSITASYTVGNIGAPDVTMLSQDISCHGACDGTVTAAVVNGSGYSYSWSNGSSGATQSGLCPGTYTVTVDDGSGCLAIESVTLTEPAEIIIDSIVTTPTACGDSNGVIEVFAHGGEGTLTYLINGVDTVNPIINVAGGTYTVEVADTTGCSVSQIVPVPNTGSFGITVSKVDVTCFDECNGQAFVNIGPPPGTGPYSIQWTTDVNDTLNTLTDLCPGTYGVQVTDETGGCVAVDSVTIEAPDEIELDNVITATPDCGQNNGSIEVIASGGVGSLNYQWNGGPADSVYNNISAGLYEITVSDANGCTLTEIVPLSNPTSPSISVTTQDASCNGDCNGSAEVTVAGSDYEVMWSNNETTEMIAGLCPGNYGVVVTDTTNGCIAADTGSVGTKGNLDIELDILNNSNCNALTVCEGEIEAIVTGGDMPISYNWSNAGTPDSNVLAGLCAGTYSVTATGNNGCEAIAVGQVVDVPALDVTVDTVIDAQCWNSNNGSVDISISGGNPEYTINWNGPGYSGDSADIDNLLPGEYTLRVADEGDCVVFDTIQVGTQTRLSVSALDTTLCGLGDTVEVYANASSDYPITYEWQNNAGQTIDTGRTTTVIHEERIERRLVFASSNGCVRVDTAIVRSRGVPVADAGNDTTIVAGARIRLGGNPTSNEAGSTYEWGPDQADLSGFDIANPYVRPEQTSTYSLKVTNIYGCETWDFIRVTVTNAFDFPDGFSPNGDGKNDVWELDFLSEYRDCNVKIFNRWGQVVFESEGYDEPWDGTYNGNDLPVGSYYYVIDLGTEDFTEPITGPVTIMR